MGGFDEISTFIPYGESINWDNLSGEQFGKSTKAVKIFIYFDPIVSFPEIYLKEIAQTTDKDLNMRMFITILQLTLDQHGG